MAGPCYIIVISICLMIWVILWFRARPFLEVTTLRVRAAVYRDPVYGDPEARENGHFKQINTSLLFANINQS